MDEPPTSGRRRGLSANVAANATTRLSAAAIAFFLSPFIVAHLGLAEFGFWALIAGFVQYAALLDFGTGAALTKYVAELDSLGEHEQIRHKVAAGSRITALVCVAILAATAMLEFALGQSNLALPAGANTTIWGVALALCGTIITSQLAAFPQGLGRWDLQAIPFITNQLVYAALAIVALVLGFGLAGLGVALAIASGCSVIAGLVVRRRVWRGRLPLRGYGRGHFGELLRYGANLQVGVLATIINSQADKPFILLAGGSLEFVGMYELGSKVAMQLRAIPLTALGPISAHVAGTLANAQIHEIRDYYQAVYPRLVNLGVALPLAAAGCSFPLVLAWLGNEFGDAALIAAVLGAAFACNFATGPGTLMAIALGRPDLERNYALLGILLNVGFSIALGLAFGPWGVIAATTVALVSAAFYFLISADRWLRATRAASLILLARSRTALILGLSIAVVIPLVTVEIGAESRIANLAIGLAGLSLTLVLAVLFVPDVRTPARRLVGAFSRRNAPLSTNNATDIAP